MKDLAEGCFKIIGVVLVAFLVAVLLNFLTAYFVVLCWNYVMPTLFGLPQITYWQAFVLSLLCGMLFQRNINYNKD